MHCVDAGIDESATSCTRTTPHLMYDNDTEVYCAQWAAPLLLGIYLLIANVLLLNLLIAIFR